MYFIFTSFWNYKFYYVYGFVLLVFTILLIVSACVSIVITYSFFFSNCKFYYVYGFVLLVCTILLFVSARVSIVITYCFYYCKLRTILATYSSCPPVLHSRKLST